jgi:hypothetical protein
MDFARSSVLAAVVAVDDGIHRPSADQPAVERHLVGAVGCGTAGLQCADERVGRHVHLFRCSHFVAS